MRWDEVSHAAEVQGLKLVFENSAKIVDVAGIDTRIFILPREVSILETELRSQQRS